jgi:hypothetical protein
MEPGREGREEDKNLTPQRHGDTEKTSGRNNEIKVDPSSSSSEPATEVTERTEVCGEPRKYTLAAKRSIPLGL